MESTRIADLLTPFLGPHSLTPEQLDAITVYLDLLIRWNARVNLTAVRDEEAMVARHFGESLFLAAHLFSGVERSMGSTDAGDSEGRPGPRVVDLGSGAGFPGLPLKIYRPSLQLTLIESNHKKAAFLREVIRGLKLGDADVFAGRGEDLSTAGGTGAHAGVPPDVVTMRAVERFESALSVASRLAQLPGATRNVRLVLLVGKAQVAGLDELAPDFNWEPLIPVPQSRERVLVVGTSKTG